MRRDDGTNPLDDVDELAVKEDVNPNFGTGVTIRQFLLHSERFN